MSNVVLCFVSIERVPDRIHVHDRLEVDLDGLSLDDVPKTFEMFG